MRRPASFLALAIVHDHQIRQPVDALEDDTAAPVDRKAAAASGVETPPQMRTSRDFAEECNISFAVE